MGDAHRSRCQNLTELERKSCVYNVRFFVEIPNFRFSTASECFSDYTLKTILGEKIRHGVSLFEMLFSVCFYANGDKPENQGYISTLLTFAQTFSDWKITYFSLTAIIAVIDVHGDLRYLQSFAEEHDLEVEWRTPAQARYRFGLEKYLKRAVVLNSTDLLHGDTLKLSCDIAFSTTPSPAKVQLCQTLFDQQALHEEWFKTITCQLEPIHSCRHFLKFDNENTPLCTSLQQRSAYFQQLFNTSLEERSSKLLPIADEEYSAFFNMLCYIRFDTLNHVYRMDDYFDLYVVADKYQVLDLKMRCSQHMRSHITIKIAAKMLVLADMCNDLNLKQFVIHYILTNKYLVIQTSDWELLVKEQTNLAREIIHVNGDSEEFLPSKNHFDWFSSKNYFKMKRLFVSSAGIPDTVNIISESNGKIRSTQCQSVPAQNKAMVPSPPKIITQNREQNITNVMQEFHEELLGIKPQTPVEITETIKYVNGIEDLNFDFYK